MFQALKVRLEATAEAKARFFAPGQQEGFKAKLNEVRENWEDGQRVFWVGLGEADRPDRALLAAGALGRRLASAEVKSVAFDGDIDAEALGTGLAVLSWDNRFLKGTATPKSDWPELEIVLSEDAQAEAFERGVLLGQAINRSRTLSLTPPNIATTSFIADEAKKLAEEFDLKVKVMKGKILEEERLEGLINVGKASENEPMLIRLEYRPKGAKGKPVVLVGKTMTYDTGGLSLKPREGMVGMKQDKDGGCAVLGAMAAIAGVLKPKVPVVALLCTAENSVSDEAYRPDDVITFRNGVTVEVTNTDAEGRLVLADGLCWACDEEDPQLIVDIATLTGGVVVALGKVFAGAFSNSDDAFELLSRASAASGERVWRLPLHAEYREMMNSPVADMINSNANRQAHPVQGATFLSCFVKPEIPWIHLDIAGVHNADAEFGPFIKGPNGWGVRLLTEIVRAVEA